MSVSGIDNVMKLLCSRVCYVVAIIVTSSYFITTSSGKNIILFFSHYTLKGLSSNTKRHGDRDVCLKRIHMYIHNSYEKKINTLRTLCCLRVISQIYDTKLKKNRSRLRWHRYITLESSVREIMAREHYWLSALRCGKTVVVIKIYFSLLTYRQMVKCQKISDSRKYE